MGVIFPTSSRSSRQLRKELKKKISPKKLGEVRAFVYTWKRRCQWGGVDQLD